MPAPADRAAILDRERRFMRPAGILSIVGVFLIAIGLGLRISSLNADGAADALLELNADDLGGRLLLGAIVSGLGYLCLGAPLTHIFLAARARSERVRNGLVGLAVIGVVFLAIGGVVSSSALSSAADDFAASEAERSSAPAESSPAADAAAEKKDTAPGELGASEDTASGEDEGGAANGETTVEATTTTTETNAASETDSASDSADDAEDAADDRAEDAIKDASGYGIGGIFGLVGTLAFAIGYFYTSLWGMRTGLLTRFWGSLGMACSVVFVLLAQGAPEILFFQELWFAVIGLMLIGFWVGGRPPAWEAGTALPWPARGDAAAVRARDSVEGEGRDVTGEPLDDPSDPRGDDAGDSTNGSPPPSDPPRKRKRRN